MFRRVMVGTVWVLACLFLFVNPTGLWPLIPFIAVTGWVELSNLMVARQMRAELRQVLDGQRP